MFNFPYFVDQVADFRKGCQYFLIPRAMGFIWF